MEKRFVHACVRYLAGVLLLCVGVYSPVSFHPLAGLQQQVGANFGQGLAVVWLRGGASGCEAGW